MRMREFIRQNREEIDEWIDFALSKSDDSPKRIDREREEWISNDEGLYNWARREGVPI